MPSGEVLRSISEANALRKKQAEEDRERTIASDNMNLALNRQTFATNASKIADDLLLGSDIKLTSSLEDQEKTWRLFKEISRNKWAARHFWNLLGLTQEVCSQ